ncbi:ABC transporter ATP-binding protein [Amphibacillus sediminis]|uniref:ABC transporter ATP-binding protein n=1 Tax=Amphibacillus sediminis TaxID=360185 RepID=UPI00082D2661|nr:ABC transporter ATP-binding protein [Amphibacillus sediminis]
MSEHLISMKNVAKTYDEFKLDKVSLNIPKGKIIGLIGENGSGKTTIIKLILNEVQKDSGEILVFGKKNDLNIKSNKEDLAVIFDTNHFHEIFNAQEIGKFMKKIIHRWDDHKYEELLATFNLPANKPIKDFSHGMKVKLNFAIVLSYAPKLLILDEATNGLDPMVRREILDILQRYVANKERSVFISSHIISDLDRIADQIILLHQGNILLDEEKETLLNKYGIATCTNDYFNKINPNDILMFNRDFGKMNVLVTDRRAFKQKHPKCEWLIPNLEDLLYLFVRGERA